MRPVIVLTPARMSAHSGVLTCFLLALFRADAGALGQEDGTSLLQSSVTRSRSGQLSEVTPAPATDLTIADLYDIKHVSNVDAYLNPILAVLDVMENNLTGKEEFLQKELNVAMEELNRYTAVADAVDTEVRKWKGVSPSSLYTRVAYERYTQQAQAIGSNTSAMCSLLKEVEAHRSDVGTKLKTLVETGEPAKLQATNTSMTEKLEAMLANNASLAAAVVAYTQLASKLQGALKKLNSQNTKATYSQLSNESLSRDAAVQAQAEVVVNLTAEAKKAYDAMNTSHAQLVAAVDAAQKQQVLLISAANANNSAKVLQSALNDLALHASNLRKLCNATTNLSSRKEATLQAMRNVSLDANASAAGIERALQDALSASANASAVASAQKARVALLKAQRADVLRELGRQAPENQESTKSSRQALVLFLGAFLVFLVVACRSSQPNDPRQY